MVKKGKPDPETFLAVAHDLKSEPQNCIVIEDGTSGMLAAKIAGMKCIGLVRDTKGTYPTKNLISSLREITPRYLSGLNDKR